MTYTPSIIAQLEAGELVLRDFLVVEGQTLGGSAVTFAYWTGEDNVAQNVTPPGASTPVSTNFRGAGTLLDAPQIVDVIGLEAATVTFDLDHASTAENSPMDMVFGHNIRIAPVAYYQGVFNPETWHVIDAPILLFSGRVDGASVNDAAAGGEGGLALDVVSAAIELTVTNPAVKSQAQQALRGGDEFRKWGDTAGNYERWWGQVKGKAA
ncbi:hypothetical protein [Pelagibacterium sediminicola]|uniref:hypothetical protein n=1 Tax=Pelagibacterium sediminicola TaxID=2248761 RepID=UPI000E313928|nr:hypothetical protein [Pelagibacterium sediminicola]